ERWSVTFEKQLPIIIRFDEDRVGITLRLSGVTRDGQWLQAPIEIQASFIPKIMKEGPSLFRDGDLTVRLPNATPGDDQASLREFLTRKFGAVFPPELNFNGLTPPAGGSLGKLRLLEPAEFRSASGWLTLAYELVGQVNPATLPLAQSTLRPSEAR